MGWRALQRDWLVSLRRAARNHARVRTIAALACAASLMGCASFSEKIADTMSTMPAVGLPASVPERPATQAAFPAVHDMPPTRQGQLLNNAEQQRMEDELVAARTLQQEASAGGPPHAAKKKSPANSAPRVVPVSSSGTIY
jgi:hypothetical protein